MNRKMTIMFAGLASMSAVSATSFAQGVQQVEAIASSDVLSQISMYSYRDGPKSDLLFRGTPIAANAEGKAQVEFQSGNAQISAEVKNLPAPASLGPYTTYVLWALTPDGRATNQGVIGGAAGGKGEVDTQYGASQFALIVTAEPHFAVTMPSTMIALYNVADDVKGEESKVTTLTERADYARLTDIAVDDDANPLEIVQARYAVAIAQAAGADRFASDAYATANQKLAAAQTMLDAKRRSERKTAPGLAREAVIAGEDARRSAMIASAASAAEAGERSAANAATQRANSVARAAAAEAASAATVAATEAATAATAATEAATSAERDRSAVAARNDLRNQLNAALPTRDSARGLVSEIGGVQFATGTADANVPAREGLAKFSGVVASYPGLRFSVEGHTDSVGSAAMNNELSLRRALTVRDYLIGQGVAASSIDVVGHGLSMPIGDNSTADGRARNRRVEIVLSGGPLAAL
jgi:outer membrane protein OmpA-like peptidoglycan-associated protein